MDGKKIILLVGALFVAAVTAIMAKSMFGAATPVSVAALPQQQPVGPEVLVATKPLPVGTILGPDAVQYRPWPKQLVDGAYFVRGAPGVDPTKLQGMVVRTAITVGQPLTQGALVSPQDRGFLAAALTPGMRAVTVSVGPASGVAGFVFPGDRVDLMLTQQVAGSNNSGALNATETIVRNIRVLATDQRYSNEPDPDGKTPIKSFSLVTLEATPKIAEKIEVAEKIGTLSLALRPLADTTEQLQQEVAVGNGQTPGGTDSDAERKLMLELASRPQDDNASYTTGGQVSRFQRTTLPPQGTSASTPMLAGSPAPDQARDPAHPELAQVTGPIVRVARGNTVTVTPVGDK